MEVQITKDQGQMMVVLNGESGEMFQMPFVGSYLTCHPIIVNEKSYDVIYKSLQEHIIVMCNKEVHYVFELKDNTWTAVSPRGKGLSLKIDSVAESD